MFKWLLIKILNKYHKNCLEELDLACFSYDCVWLTDEQQQKTNIMLWKENNMYHWN